MKGFSFIFGTYSYFFFPPILHFSLEKLNILGIINLSTSIIISNQIIFVLLNNYLF